VAFPVFLYLSVVTERSVRQDPAKRRSQVRRWLMYLTTFVAASVLIGDVIALVYSALAGERTTRFVLKIATIALIGGLALLYYLSDLKLEDTRPSAAADRVRRPVTAFAIVIAVASASAGLYAVGRPAEERMRRADDRRIDDLAAIEAAAAVYFKRHGRLPDSLDELGPEGGVKLERWDPSGTDYEYRVTAPHAYELCATFVRESEPGRNWRGADWAHGPGRVCFPKTVKQSTE
jgi:hypothetical protein